MAKCESLTNWLPLGLARRTSPNCSGKESEDSRNHEVDEKGYVTIKAPEMELTSYKRTKVSKKEFEIPKTKVSKSNDKALVKEKQKSDNTEDAISKEATKLFKSFF